MSQQSIRHLQRQKEKGELLYEVLCRRKIPKRFCRKLWYGIQDILKWCFYYPFPPCPSVIIPKVAFEIPISTYILVATESFTNMIPVYKFQMKPRYKLLSHLFKSVHVHRKQRKNVKAYFIHPTHTKQLACYYMTCFTEKASFVIFRCHSNAADLGLDLSLNAYISWRLSCDIFEFDYCGYGNSTGKPNELNLYKDVMAAYEFLTKYLNVDPTLIVVFGQSIGTIPAIHLASSGVVIRGLILDGLLMSAFKIFCPTSRKPMGLCGDQFLMFDKVPLITCPTLVLHGGLDDMIFIEHAEYFCELCQSLVPPLFIPDGGHCDLIFHRAYWNRLEIFVAYELGGKKIMPYYHYCSVDCPVVHSVKHNECSDCHHGLSYPFKLHRDLSVCFKCDLGKCSEKPGYKFCLIE